MWTCTRCRSPNHPGYTHCSVCRTAAPAASGTLPTQNAAPPGGWSGQQAGFGGQVGVPPQAAPAAARTPTKKKSSAAGCGIAGCLGIAAVIVACVIGLVVFANVSISFIGLGDDDEEAEDDDDRGDDDDDDDDDDDHDDGKKRRKPKGALRDNVPKKVGKYKVSSVKPVEVEGAIDSFVVVYKGRGKRLEHALAVYPSKKEAQEALLKAARRAHAKTFVEGKTRKIKDEDGNESGLASHFKGDPEILVYRIDKMMAVIYGPPGEVIPFFEKLP